MDKIQKHELARLLVLAAAGVWFTAALIHTSKAYFIVGSLFALGGVLYGHFVNHLARPI